MFKALILLDNEFMNDAIDLIATANQLAGEDAVTIYGLGLNLVTKNIKGFDSIISIEDSSIQMKDSRILTDIIEQVHQKFHFDAIIVLATDFGRMLAPRLAMRLNVGIVADITAIEVINQERRLIRPAYSGNMLASIVCDSTPIMISVHPNVFHVEACTKEPKIIHFPINKVKASSIEVISISKNEEIQDIREAKVIVSAGAGFKADIDTLEGLANELGGSIAASKPLVEQQRVPREIQVGQSGKTVSPNLYIALGIYGSMQHVEGLKDVKDIISVNLDEGAPMNYLANLTVIGDAAEFVEKLNLKLKAFVEGGSLRE